MTQLTDREFAGFQRFIHGAAGITLSAAKKSLVSGRLNKRLVHFGLSSYAQYLDLLGGPGAGAEAQMAVDLLTTNETYFFREGRHFELLAELAQRVRASAKPMRAWSAACSSGEEVYSIAMVLAEALPEPSWEVVGSDISRRVLAQAQAAHYPETRTRLIPPAYLKRYCLRGIGDQQGTLLVQRALRQRVRFAQVNLNTPLPPRLGQFDAIFLRNVMIYFSNDTKRQVIARVIAQLKPGGLFFIGHSESLNDLSSAVVQVAPSVYRKP